jgi:hypothetical protein
MMTLDGARAQLADLEKRRKDRKEREALAPAHAASEGFVEAECGPDGHCDTAPMAAGDAGKAVTDRGATPGPGTSPEPGSITPEQAQRPYLQEGHASRSPLAGPPRQNPLPPAGRGILQPVELPGTPVVAGHAGPMMSTLAAHQAKAQLRPPIPPGRTQ